MTTTSMSGARPGIWRARASCRTRPMTRLAPPRPASCSSAAARKPDRAGTRPIPAGRASATASRSIAAMSPASSRRRATSSIRPSRSGIGTAQAIVRLRNSSGSGRPRAARPRRPSARAGTRRPRKPAAARSARARPSPIGRSWCRAWWRSTRTTSMPPCATGPARRTRRVPPTPRCHAMPHARGSTRPAACPRPRPMTAMPASSVTATR